MNDIYVCVTVLQHLAYFPCWKC